MRRFLGALVLFVTIVNTDYIRKKGGRTTITTPLVVDGLSLRSTLRRRRLSWRRATKQPHQKEQPDLQREAIQHELEKEMRSISFYSFLHNAALPLADLVDGYFMSVLPASSLGAIGVVRSSQNSVSKLYNSPLSKTTISLVASASGKRQARQDEATANATSTNTASASVVVSNDDEKEATTMESLPVVVSSALLLAVMLGTIQALVFCIGAKSILHASGIDYGTDMYAPAMSFMKARALSAPTATLWLVATNVFRGLGDATTPLMCAILMNLVNWLGDYLLIRKFHVGIAATAIGTTVAQFVALLPLLYRLQRRHVRFWMKTSLASFRQYLQRYGAAGIYLIGRSMARIAAVSYCARRSVRFNTPLYLGNSQKYLAISHSFVGVASLSFYFIASIGSIWIGHRLCLQCALSTWSLGHHCFGRSVNCYPILVVEVFTKRTTATAEKCSSWIKCKDYIR